jgi:hypothetical protein
MKFAIEKVLDPMNLCGDIAWRKARDLANRRGVHSLQVQKHDLLVVRLEFLNQRPDVIEGRPLDWVTPVLKGCFDFFEIHKGRGPHLLPDDDRRGCIVSDSINPGLERASSFEVFEALPESDMNFLK